MTPNSLARRLALALVFAPSIALAGPPDLDVSELRRGEVQLEANAWRDQEAWLVRPEIEIGLTDRIALELQADYEHGDGAGAWRNLSAQVMANLTTDGALGVAVEAGVDPETDETGFEAFIYGTHEAGPLRLDANLGAEREGADWAWVYAWRVERAMGERWALGLEGGGEVPFEDGANPAHLAGPTLGFKVSDRPVELRFGWLFALEGGEDLTRIGFEIDL